MSYIVYKVNSETLERISTVERVVSFNWQDDIEKVFTSFEFETAEELACGDWIELYNAVNKETVFYGVIFKVSQNGEENFKYLGYDTGIYLEKNETVIQFRGDNITEAMRTVCRRGLIQDGIFPDIDLLVTRVYQKKTLAHILKDLYKIAVDKDKRCIDNYYFDCKDRKVNLLECKENNDLRGYIADLYSIKSFDFIKTCEKSSSIESLKNRVQIYTSNTANKDNAGECKYTLPKKPDSESIKKYGLLNHIEEIDSSTKQNYKELAETKLKQLDVVKDEISFSVYGDNRMKTGVITSIENETLKIKASYKITSSKHTIEGTVETVDITVEKFNEKL